LAVLTSLSSWTIAKAAQPPVEDFGLHSFSLSKEQMQEGNARVIGSAQQQGIWDALANLMQSKNGYHSVNEVEAALGVKLTQTDKPKDDTDSSRWDASLPDAKITVFESGPKSRLFGESSLLTVKWNEALKRPQCISPLKVFAEIEQAGGIGFQQIIDQRRFNFQSGEEVGFSSHSLNDPACITGFLLIGHVKPSSAQF
jgi:hypothetical protein